MINYVYCPNCGTLMTEFTTFRQCSLCGYRIPPQSVTLTIGREKAKNVAEGKKAYTADTSVLKVRKEDGLIRCKDCEHYSAFHMDCYRIGNVHPHKDDYCAWAKRKEE